MPDRPSAGRTFDVPAFIRVLMPNGKVLEMKLETYLAGVVVAEMGANAPLAALKAQAVASRTYAASAHRHADVGADVCTSAHCQEWRKVDPIVAPEVFRAVGETWGIVAIHNGNLIDAFFHEHCDGQTRNSEDLLMPPVPYLRGVDCACGFVALKGHGVGLCQRGAIVMARRGASFEQILHHYYRGVVVVHTAHDKAEGIRPVASRGVTRPAAESPRPVKKAKAEAAPQKSKPKAKPAPVQRPSVSPPHKPKQAPASERPARGTAAPMRAEEAKPAVELPPPPAASPVAEPTPLLPKSERAPVESVSPPTAPPFKAPAAPAPTETEPLAPASVPLESLGQGPIPPARPDVVAPPPDPTLGLLPIEPLAVEVAPVEAVELRSVESVQVTRPVEPTEPYAPAETAELPPAPGPAEVPAYVDGLNALVPPTPAEYIEVPAYVQQLNAPGSAPIEPTQVIVLPEGFSPGGIPESALPALEEHVAAKPARVQIDHLPGGRMIAGCLAAAGTRVTIEDALGNQTLVFSGSAPHYGVGGFETVLDEDGRYIISIDGESIPVDVQGDTVFIHAS